VLDLDRRFVQKTVISLAIIVGSAIVAPGRLFI
jgi:hypothetical protein